MDKYFDGGLLSGFEESPKTTTSRYEQLGYCEYRDVKTGLVASNYIEVMNQQSNRIADLEAKLKESERKANKTNEENYQLYLKLKQFYSRLGVEAYLYEEIQDVAIKELNKLLTNTKKQYLKEISELKQQLAETDKLMQEYLSKCLNLEQQLAEKEKEIEEVKKSKTYIMNFGGKVKEVRVLDDNQTAIAELEKVKEKFGFKYNTQLMISSKGLCDYIDQRIKSLKGEK